MKKNTLLSLIIAVLCASSNSMELKITRIKCRSAGCPIQERKYDILKTKPCRSEGCLRKPKETKRNKKEIKIKTSNELSGAITTLSSNHLDSCLKMVSYHGGLKNAAGKIRELAAFDKTWAKILHSSQLTSQLIDHIYTYYEKENNPQQSYFDLFIQLSSIGAIEYGREFLVSISSVATQYNNACSKIQFYSWRNSYDDVWSCLHMGMNPNFLYTHKKTDNCDSNCLYATPALIHAILHKNYSLIDLLLVNRADPNTIDSLYKQSALALAITMNNPKIIDLLLLYGANATMPAEDTGDTPLMVAVKNIGERIKNNKTTTRAEACFKLLCLQNPSLISKNKNNQSIYDIAREYGITEKVVNIINKISEEKADKQ